MSGAQSLWLSLLPALAGKLGSHPGTVMCDVALLAAGHALLGFFAFHPSPVVPAWVLWHLIICSPMGKWEYRAGMGVLAHLRMCVCSSCSDSSSYYGKCPPWLLETVLGLLSTAFPGASAGSQDGNWHSSVECGMAVG